MKLRRLLLVLLCYGFDILIVNVTSGGGYYVLVLDCKFVNWLWLYCFCELFLPSLVASGGMVLIYDRKFLETAFFKKSYYFSLK